MTDARAVLRQYYGPSNLVTAIVGGDQGAGDHSDPREVLRAHSGASEARAAAHRSSRRRLPRPCSRCAIPSQPFYVEGYHKPAGDPRRRARLRRDRRHPDARPHVAPLSAARARQEARRRGAGRRRVPRRQVSATSGWSLGRAGARRDQRRRARRDAPELDEAQERGRHRRGAARASRRARKPI